MTGKGLDNDNVPQNLPIEYTARFSHSQVTRLDQDSKHILKTILIEWNTKCLRINNFSQNMMCKKLEHVPKIDSSNTKGQGVFIT